MKKKRYSTEQIVSALKQAEMGLPVADLVRQMGITEQTYYRWKKKYGGLESEQVRELKQVLDENTRLKVIVYDHGRRTQPGQGGPSGCAFKKVPRPSLMKQVVDYVTQTHGYSQRKACSLTRQHRSTQRKPLRTDPLTELRQRMHEIVATRIRFGYRRVHIMLKREGWQVGKHIVYRLYREEGLCLRAKRPRRRKMAVHRQARCQPSGLNQAWSLDFVHDQLSSGAKIGLLTVIAMVARSKSPLDFNTKAGPSEPSTSDRAGRLREAGLSDTGINFAHRPSFVVSRARRSDRHFISGMPAVSVEFEKSAAQFRIPCLMCARPKSVFRRA